MRQLFKDKNFVRLCLAAFFMASTIQSIWQALPFVVKSMDGSDTAAGLCFMGQMGVHVVFCILAGLVIDRFNPRKVLLLCTAAEVFIALGFFATVWYGGKNEMFLSPVMILIVLMSFTGVVTAFFWPVMTGWISIGYEGAELTKRFGFFNMTWSSATMILPVIAGYLMGVNYILPIAGAVITATLCFAAIAASGYADKNLTPQRNDPEKIIDNEIEYGKKAFVWMSRVALFATVLCVGLFRSQVGILYKFELGFAESAYGWSVAIMFLFNVAVFYMMGRSHWWHYRKIPFAVGSAAVMMSMLIIFLSKSLAMQFFAAGLGGICYGFVYSSHQYYSVSGGTKRSGLIAVHEIVLGAGISTGALFGGILSDAFGGYSPYKYACVLVAAAAIVQAILWFWLRKKDCGG